jgi:hypothetical protein
MEVMMGVRTVASNPSSFGGGGYWAELRRLSRLRQFDGDNTMVGKVYHTMYKLHESAKRRMLRTEMNLHSPFHAWGTDATPILLRLLVK